MNGKIQVNSGDVSIIAVNVDGQSVDEIPSKGKGKYFESADCDNEAIGIWDNINWEFRIQKLTKVKTKCKLNFTTNPTNQNGENKMENLLGQENNNDEKLGTIIEDNHNNIRYIGKNPNNYVNFNCKDGNNCETWRIIGLMDNIQTATNGTQKLLKIIREPFRNFENGKETGYSINRSWDSSASNINVGYGVNEWSQADLMTVLNEDYFQAKKIEGHKCYRGSENYELDCPEWEKIGLSEEAQNMVEEVIWNTGTSTGDEDTWQTGNIPLVQYMWERGIYTGKRCSTTGSYSSYCSDDVQRKTTWTGKVGLMYPSDYGYATDGGGTKIERNKCLWNAMSLARWIDTCYQNDWLYDSSITYQWTMTPAPDSTHASKVFRVETFGGVSIGDACDTSAIRPVVYLKSSVKISGGDGSSENPFTLTSS